MHRCRCAQTWTFALQSWLCLIEHDWSEESTGCGAHSHKPPLPSLTPVSQAFAAAPVQNPNGSTGINLIHDYGQGGVFNGGNLINIPNGSIQGGLGADFAGYKTANFATNRIGFFRYAIHTHLYTNDPISSGLAEVVGDDFIVTLQCSAIVNYIRNTTMHELGHNIGLQHGGGTACNHKPNYNSVMNYNFQFDGIDTNCDRIGDGVLNYSIGNRAPLDESNLNEGAGICGGVSIDWNGMFGIQSSVSFDINQYGQQVSQCGATISLLTDNNDWASLNLASLPGAPGSGAAAPPVTTSCAPTPPAGS